MDLKQTTVLFFSEVDWNYLKQRHHIFSENYVKYKNHVIYIGRIGLRYPQLKDLKLNISNISRIRYLRPKNITLFPKGFLPPINGIFNLVNEIYFLPKLLKQVTTENVIIHYYQPTSLVKSCYNKLKKKNISVKLLYDCVQDYRYHPAQNKRLLNLEKELVNKSDLIIADSKINFERLDSEKKLLVPPGVESEHFRIIFKKRKENTRILYFGNIRQDLDITLLNKIATSTKFQLTLVGLLNISNNRLNTNIILKPAVSYSELPNIIAEYDILLLPYKLNNEFTKAIIPAKFFECLATGLPIMSTAMQSLEPYKPLLNIISVNTNFDKINIHQISMAEQKEREEILSLSSWERRFESFYKKIDWSNLSQQ